MSNSLQHHGLQHFRLPWPLLSPRVCSNSCPLSQWCHPTIWCFVTLFSSCPQYFPASGFFPTELVLHIRWHQTFQRIFRVGLIQDWLVWSPFCPRNSRESSPEPQFKGVNSLVLCLLYGPALTTICNQWENHSLDYIDLSLSHILMGSHSNYIKLAVVNLSLAWNIILNTFC